MSNNYTSVSIDTSNYSMSDELAELRRRYDQPKPVPHAEARVVSPSGNYQLFSANDGRQAGPSDATFRGPMSQGVDASNPDGLIQVGDMRTSPENAERMRQSYSPEDWFRLTGLPYVPVAQAEFTKAFIEGTAKKIDPAEKAREAAEAEARHLAQVEAEQRADAEERARIEADTVHDSPLRQAIEQHHGKETADRLLFEAFDTGEPDVETLTKLGATPEMIEEERQFFVAECDKALEPVGATVKLMNSLLEADELRTARRALVNHDLSTVRRLGNKALDRLAALPTEKGLDAFREFIKAGGSDPVALGLKVYGNNVSVTINGREMSWAAAVLGGHLQIGS